jgi:uncharacterized protein
MIPIKYNELKESIMENNIANAARKLLDKNNDGHGFDHIERVCFLAKKFAKTEHANQDTVILACLLHDVDDYKLFGEESAKNLSNAKKILHNFNVDHEKQLAVIEIIKTMGYGKYLSGIRPNTVEGKVVSDADMCDAIGAEGILRAHAYNLSKGSPFFDKTIPPNDVKLSAQEYITATPNHAIQHFFDKLLKIPSIMMTKSGQKEAKKRQKTMIDFLVEFFREENSSEWLKYLNKFIAKK